MRVYGEISVQYCSHLTYEMRLQLFPSSSCNERPSMGNITLPDAQSSSFFISFCCPLSWSSLLPPLPSTQKFHLLTTQALIQLVVQTFLDASSSETYLEVRHFFGTPVNPIQIQLAFRTTFLKKYIFIVHIFYTTK